MNADIIAFRATAAVVIKMLESGIITEKECDEICVIIAKKHGILLDNIWGIKPLIYKGSRGNMSPTKRGD